MTTSILARRVSTPVCFAVLLQLFSALVCRAAFSFYGNGADSVPSPFEIRICRVRSENVEAMRYAPRVRHTAQRELMGA